MSAFDWDPALETGNAVIDEQHRALFALAQKLSDAVAGKIVGGDAVADAVHMLNGYAVQHFEDEEALMESVGFSGLGSHRDLHRRLTSEVRLLASRYFEGEDVLPETLAPFLTDLLRWHIRSEDMRFVEFLRRRGM